MRILAHYALDETERARLDRISASIADCFSAGGYRRIALPVLQPADLYLDMAGEDIRERMFVFEDPSGVELCLRVDLTIPVCRFFIDDASASRPARLACIGPIFRFEAASDEEPTELIQAGIECLAASDALAADVEVLGLARAALDAAGAGPVVVGVGDVSLFPALLAELKLDQLWARRLNYAFRHPSLLQPTLRDLRKGARARTGPSPELALASQEAAERFVLQRLGSDEPVARRTIVEIAERLLDKAKAAALAPPRPDALDAIEEFISIVGPADDSLDRLKGIGSKAGPFAAACRRVESRIAGMRGRMRPGDEITFSAVLGRSFVYYTGFVFNLTMASLDVPLAAGGRYDRLMSDLGSSEPIDAVGCALWPERILAAEAGCG